MAAKKKKKLTKKKTKATSKKTTAPKKAGVTKASASKKAGAPKKMDVAKKTKRSALHVMPGVEGGHDGMPGEDGKTGTVVKKRAARNEPTIEEYAEGVRAGDRTLLGRAITLIESNAVAHQERAQSLLKALGAHDDSPDGAGKASEAHKRTATKAIRIGITGVPGSGKSTLIESLGTKLTAQGHKVAVMAVDPSSTVSRGSILGDKTRMESLSRNPDAFIRPTPTGGTLGGVARKTRETMVLFEAAGFDVLLVETVGVGQNEVAVRSMVDFFLLVLVAGAGDELQGIKKGVMELADAVVINKADGNNVMAAETARAEYERALHYLQPATPGWVTRAFTTSALTGDGVDALWETIIAFRAATEKSGAFEARRGEQARQWLRRMIEEQLRSSFYNHPEIRKVLTKVEREVMDGTLPVARAAMDLLKIFEDPADR